MKKAAGGAEASSEQQGLKRNSKISELRNSPERNQQFLLDLAQPVPHLPLFLGKRTAHAPHQGRAQCVITTQYSPLENGNRNPKLSKKIISGGMQQSGNQATGMLAGMAFEH